MPHLPKILIVDDDEGIRVTAAMLLVAEGYEISTAEDGFDALRQMRNKLPDLVISDLNMPRMSGFEFLSVVRRRFPQVLVVASSGSYRSGEAVPGGVVADAFYAKGADNVPELLTSVAQLLRTALPVTPVYQRHAVPVWVSQNGRKPNGMPFVQLSCNECLRVFSQDVGGAATGTVMQAACTHCGCCMSYIVDFSRQSDARKKESCSPLDSRTAN